MSDIDPEKLREGLIWFRQHWVGRNIIGFPPDTVSTIKMIADAAEAHIPHLFKTKEVEVWHLEFAVDGEPDVTVFWGDDAEKKAREACEATIDQDASAVNHADVGYVFTCVRVTGPHKHVVPA
jgi:hypothetical protein